MLVLDKDGKTYLVETGPNNAGGSLQDGAKYLIESEDGTFIIEYGNKAWQESPLEDQDLDDKNNSSVEKSDGRRDANWFEDYKEDYCFGREGHDIHGFKCTMVCHKDKSCSIVNKANVCTCDGQKISVTGRAKFSKGGHILDKNHVWSQFKSLMECHPSGGCGNLCSRKPAKFTKTFGRKKKCKATTTHAPFLPSQYDRTTGHPPHHWTKPTLKPTTKPTTKTTPKTTKAPTSKPKPTDVKTNGTNMTEPTAWCAKEEEAEESFEIKGAPGVKLIQQELYSSMGGRHLLMLSLLESPKQKTSSHKFCGGRIRYKFPSSFENSLYNTRLKKEASGDYEDPFGDYHEKEDDDENVTEIKLEDLPATKGAEHESEGEGWTGLDELIEELEMEKIMSIERGRCLSEFDRKEMSLCRRLSEILCRREKFGQLLTCCAALRDHVNENLYQNALEMVIMNRTDLGNSFPIQMPIPKADNLEAAFEAGTDYQLGGGNNARELDINWNEPPFQTLPKSEPESNLWYFREDPEMNSNHRNWHLVYSTQDFLHREGELFWHMHGQALARYHVDRLAFGMSAVEPLGPHDWEQDIPLGYDPKLNSVTGYQFGARPDNQRMGMAASYPNLRAIENAIERMRYETNETYGPQPLAAVDGRDDGGNIVAAIVDGEWNDRSEYGNLHGEGHVHLGSLLQEGEGQNLGVMFTFGTSMRDPVFWRWHKFIDNVIFSYKEKLARYTRRELDFPGVRVENISVYTRVDRRRRCSRNEFHTFIDPTTLVHQCLDLAVPRFCEDSTLVRVRYNRLNYRRFRYVVHLHSRHSTKAMVRIFLVPKNVTKVTRDHIVIMDKFLVNLNLGDNVLERGSERSAVTTKRGRSLYELQEALASNQTRDWAHWEGCGWPDHLLVPRGTEEGLDFKLVVMLTDLLPGDAANAADSDQVENAAHEMCGLFGQDLPDSRPLGFPFDRPFAEDRVEAFLAGNDNWKAEDVKIFHHPSEYWE